MSSGRNTLAFSAIFLVLAGNALDCLAAPRVGSNVCDTPGCANAAASILKNMDTSVNPCDNFHKFACGNYIKETVIPDDKSRVSLFTSLNEILQGQLKKGIENEIADNDPRSFKLLKSFYDACMDTEQIEESSENDFLEVIRNVGGWPVLKGSAWKESSFDWKELVYKLRDTGYSYSYFIDFNVDVDLKDNSQRVIMLDQASLGINQKYLLNGPNEKVVKAYFKFMIDFAEIFGASRVQAEKELKEALDFEIALAKISLTSEERRDYEKLYNPMTIKQLQTKYPSIPWLDYINKVLGTETKVDSQERIIVAVPTYLEAFAKLIAKTPKRVVANYAMWRVAFESSSLLGKKVQNARREYLIATTGVSVQQPRWEECISQATNNLHVSAGALYIRRYFDADSKANAEELLKDLRNSYKKILQTVDWMDEKTRKAALEKLEYIEPYIAYPAEFLDDEKLDEYHVTLKIDPASFLKSKLNINAFSTDYSFSLLKKPVDKNDWVTFGHSAIVNAFYYPERNSMVFPAGILQGGFFTSNRPRYLNYGAIGWVMGHEMTHGFDDQGSQFDKNGNLLDWWQPETKKQYLERAQCIIDQYSNYTVEQIGLKLNGENTQGENIADNGGIKEAYFAYNDWEQRNGQEPQLPGLPYTSQQMFWIGAANIWCDKYRSEELRTRVLTDPHSPGEFRIIGPLSNMPEFAKDFNCPLGSNMNPVKKCTVW